MMKLHLSVAALLLVLSTPAKSQSKIDHYDFYEQGLAKRDSVHWQEALNIWLSGRDSLAKKNDIDPRIGIGFIELATQKKASNYYEQANELYFWGLSKPSIRKYKDELREEIDRIQPLLDDETYSEWVKLLKKGNVGLFNKIKFFWIRNDPIPTTEINERLLEHWQRIGYAREHFNEEQTTVYGTDDRGLIYVKYGEPDKKLAGKLGQDQLEIMRWFPTDFQLRQEIQRFNNNPLVEIWVYIGLRKKKSTVFLFGKKAGFGRYRLRYGVEEFIPERAFRRINTRTTQGMMPGAFIQLMYYSELIHADRFFLDRFRELEALWANSRAAGELNPNRDVLLGLIRHYKSQDEDRAEFKYLLPQKTDKLVGFEPVELNYKVFRYLDGKRSPRIMILTASANQTPDQDFRPVFFKRAQKTKYKFRHSLLSYNNNWAPVDDVTEYPAIHNYNTSIFQISANGRRSGYTLVAEKVLLDVRKTKITLADIPDTAKVIGIHSAFLGQLAPLSSDSTSLEVSDLIVGVKTPPLDQSIDYAFPVTPRDPVRRTDSLQVYVEIYNPTSASEAALKIDFDLQGLKNGMLDKKKKNLAKSFEFAASQSRIGKTFQFDIANFEPGEYRLTLRIRNKKTGKERIRTATFQIVG
ncbi:MAG: GWxTD domain-containing protein [bacterium]